MAIQVRRGNESDFDASKMLPGEWAVSLDTKYVRMCFAPGVVLRMSTYEAFEADVSKIKAILEECRTIEAAIRRIQTEVNSKASLTVEYANSARESADRAYTEAERAKTYADNAEAVTGVNIATQERAGLIKGGDNYIAEDGTLVLIEETTSPTLPNSHAGRFKFDKIGGVMEQDSQTGKNLLEISMTSGTTGRITYTLNDDKSITVTGARTGATAHKVGTAILDVGTYTYGVAKGSFTNMYVMIERPDGSSTTYASPFVFEVTEAGLYTFWLKGNQTGVSCSGTGYLQVESGSTMTDYEPYTGGQPAPNPSYPQEIKKSVVSGVKTHRKNFVDRDNLESGGLDNVGNETEGSAVVRSEYILARPSMTYSSSKAYDTNRTAFYLYDENKNFIERILSQNPTIGNPFSFTFNTNGAKYVRFSVAKLNITDGTNYSDIQLEEGTVATEYEPYTSTEITFSQPIELYGKDGLQDVIMPREIGRKYMSISISSEITVYINNDFTKDNTIAFYTSISHKAMPYSNVKALCSHFEHNASLSSADTECFRIGGNTLYFRVNKSRLSSLDVDGIKSFLAEIEPIKVVYELETETTEALPIADQIALNSLLTYDGITYVEFIYEGLEPTFKGEYGTSKVGGYTLESLLTARNNDLRITAVESAVVNSL